MENETREREGSGEEIVIMETPPSFPRVGGSMNDAGIGRSPFRSWD
jgi:hypothetical protein